MPSLSERKCGTLETMQWQKELVLASGNTDSSLFPEEMWDLGYLCNGLNTFATDSGRNHLDAQKCLLNIVK